MKTLIALSVLIAVILILACLPISQKDIDACVASTGWQAEHCIVKLSQ